MFANFYPQMPEDFYLGPFSEILPSLLDSFQLLHVTHISRFSQRRSILHLRPDMRPVDVHQELTFPAKNRTQNIIC